MKPEREPQEARERQTSRRGTSGRNAEKGNGRRSLKKRGRGQERHSQTEVYIFLFKGLFKHGGLEEEKGKFREGVGSENYPSHSKNAPEGKNGARSAWSSFVGQGCPTDGWAGSPSPHSHPLQATRASWLSLSSSSL
uniref:Uncharacterized protein n=1 Tax=Pipistrellus kuhlii TaxID=59472 RepID=A0A7J7ZJB6_PIPKU|nr:hypothetical protein mPipKuh1_009445 [Pipistrellus kuhlii]